MQRKIQTNVLIEITLMALIATLFSYLPINLFGVISIVLGGIPITILSLRRGLRAGLLASSLWGVLQILFGNAIILSFWQAIIEYPIAFTFNGFAGVFYHYFQKQFTINNHSKALLAIIYAATLGTFLRYIWHFIGGIVFWSAYAPENVSPFWFSFWPNIISVPLTAVPIVIALYLIYRSQPRLFRNY